MELLSLIPYRGTTFAIDGRPGHRVEFGSSTGGVIDRLILREPTGTGVALRIR